MGSGVSADSSLVPSVLSELNEQQKHLFTQKYDTLLTSNITSQIAIKTLVQEYEEWATNLKSTILQTILAVRMDRETCIHRLRQKLSHMKGKEYFDPLQPGVVKVTKEGSGAIEDAMNSILDTFSSLHTLEKQLATEPLLALSLAAEDHRADIGSRGVVSHEGCDSSTPSDRMNRYMTWAGGCSECIWYGNLNHELTITQLAEQVVDDLIIDDGVASRGHRLTLLNPSYIYAGVSIGSHATFGNVIVIDFVTDYSLESKSDSLRKRLEVGIPIIAGQEKEKIKVFNCNE